MKNTIILFSVILLMASCKSDIDFDYHRVAPITVVNGSVTDTGSVVIVGESLDMDDTVRIRPNTHAVVSITGSDGTSVELQHVGQGRYMPDNAYVGKPGVCYTVSVNDGGQTYYASSTMQRSIAIDSLYFKWENGALSDQVVMHIHFMDDIQQTNYYCYHIYRNSRPFKWGVFKDLGYNGTEINRAVSIMSRTKMDKNDPEDKNKRLFEGDTIHVELTSTDRNTFDYLYSLHFGQSNKQNPLSNLSGECLGYFSAHSIATWNLLFHKDQIRPLK